MHNRILFFAKKLLTMAWNIDADLKKVGENLRGLRNSRGLSIDTVAKAVNLSPQLLQQLEEGLYPECRLETIFDLIDYFGVSGEDIFGKSGK
jgi:DNA-binding XRE family transcriptional regulator